MGVDLLGDVTEGGGGVEVEVVRTNEGVDCGDVSKCVVDWGREGWPFWITSLMRGPVRGPDGVEEMERGVERRRLWVWRKDCLRVGIVGMVVKLVDSWEV